MKRIVTAAVIVAAATLAAPAAVASEPAQQGCEICDLLLEPVRDLFRPCGPLLKCP